MPRHDRAHGVWHQKSPGGGGTRGAASRRRASNTGKATGTAIVSRKKGRKNR